ncbi:MAG: polyketide cyclase [Phycisphaerales bacterium]|nr:polyketide cyclase [Phycisphaerales bacterium]
MESQPTPFRTSREIPASPEQVFAAISDPQRLARWWGPAGFTNTFGTCEFAPGGRWSFVMHGPDGKSYPNENVFAEIDPPTKVVVRHASEPRFLLTVTLASSAGGTTVSWAQAFDDAETARRIEHIVVPANDQNLDRLSAEEMREPGGG